MAPSSAPSATPTENLAVTFDFAALDLVTYDEALLSDVLGHALGELLALGGQGTLWDGEATVSFAPGSVIATVVFTTVDYARKARESRSAIITRVEKGYAAGGVSPTAAATTGAAETGAGPTAAAVAEENAAVAASTQAFVAAAAQATAQCGPDPVCRATVQTKQDAIDAAKSSYETANAEVQKLQAAQKQAVTGTPQYRDASAALKRAETEAGKQRAAYTDALDSGATDVAAAAASTNTAPASTDKSDKGSDVLLICIVAGVVLITIVIAAVVVSKNSASGGAGAAVAGARGQDSFVNPMYDTAQPTASTFNAVSAASGYQDVSPGEDSGVVSGYQDVNPNVSDTDIGGGYMDVAPGAPGAHNPYLDIAGYGGDDSEDEV